MRSSCDDAVIVAAASTTILVTRYCRIIDVDDTSEDDIDFIESVH
jgi:hypothetical protein